MGELESEKHVKYILSVEKKKDSFEALVMEHLRMNGAYWGLTTLDLLHKISAVDPEEVISWVMKCYHEDCGGFGGNVGHDPHLLYTLSAVQILALFDRIDVLDVEKVADYIRGLQNEDGSFSGDMWGEIDTRFSYCAICCLSLLRRLDKINVEKAVNYVVSCNNLDGGFGSIPGGESHSGQIFCCVGALAITGSLHHVDRDLLGWWLCERQCKDGGLNGRPEKLSDVCYSWWVLSSLIIIDRVHWIDKDKLARFILNCQDKENGGISDRPDNAVDVFHTYFGVAGLSLVEYPGLKTIDPAYALPIDVVNRIFFSNDNYGPNAAVIHYSPDIKSCFELDADSIYLFDSGAQYLDGTTDITRTVHFGKPSAHEKACYTAVLKGHIALDVARFPNGTTGHSLDILARIPLWKDGLDYRHGTGHGIGSYLNVHEGPHLISFKPLARNVSLQSSMTVTDEPGYYEDGNFGIRLENVLIVKEAATKFNFGDKGYLSFEHITWAPYQRKLMDLKLMTWEEIEWVDSYHATCREILAPFLNEQEMGWLRKATEPIRV